MIELQITILMIASIIMKWMAVGNDNLNYYDDHGYFVQLEALEKGCGSNGEDQNII